VLQSELRSLASSRLRSPHFSFLHAQMRKKGIQAWFWKRTTAMFSHEEKHNRRTVPVKTNRLVPY
jgi:hypothetical protein